MSFDQVMWTNTPVRFVPTSLQPETVKQAVEEAGKTYKLNDVPRDVFIGVMKDDAEKNISAAITTTSDPNADAVFVSTGNKFKPQNDKSIKNALVAALLDVAEYLKFDMGLGRKSA